MEARGALARDLAAGARVDDEVGARRVRVRPAGALVEAALDRRGVHGLAVGEALVRANVNLEGAVIHPAIAAHGRGADLALRGDADQLFGGVVAPRAS